MKLTRNDIRRLSSEFPVGDPFGGPAYGLKQDPVTAIMLVGTAIAGIGAIQQGQDAKNASEYNAAVAEQGAVASRQQAAANAAAAERESRKRLGAMEASYGASGVNLSEGSPLEILQQSARDAEMDRLNIIYGGEVRAGGYSNTATLDRYRGEAAETSGYLRAGSELLGGYGRSQSLTRVG